MDGAGDGHCSLIMYRNEIVVVPLQLGPSLSAIGPLSPLT
jgi:hypothetical protein